MLSARSLGRTSMNEQADPAMMPHALSGERREFHDPEAGRISYYIDGPGDSDPEKRARSSAAPPILLIHTINAAASSHEVRPVFDHYKAERCTYAIDLPGYGHSERSERTYNQQLMVDAVIAMIKEIRAQHPDRPIDAMAVSLSCEFLAKAASEMPEAIRSLALVSPTGLARRSATRGPPEADRGKPAVYRILTLPVLGRGLYRLLTTPVSVRFFLRKTFGRKDIDKQLLRDSCRVTNYPNAQRAPFHFLSGFLFSADILTVYKRLTSPVWLSHGVRGDFTDYSKAEIFADRPNWHTTVFQTGALPYFEVPESFFETYAEFLADL